MNRLLLGAFVGLGCSANYDVIGRGAPEPILDDGPGTAEKSVDKPSPTKSGEPACVDADRIIVASEEGDLYAFDPIGRAMKTLGRPDCWIKARVPQALALDRGGTLWAIDDGGTLFSIDMPSLTCMPPTRNVQLGKGTGLAVIADALGGDGAYLNDATGLSRVDLAGTKTMLLGRIDDEPVLSLIGAGSRGLYARYASTKGQSIRLVAVKVTETIAATGTKIEMPIPTTDVVDGYGVTFWRDGFYLFGPIVWYVSNNFDDAVEVARWDGAPARMIAAASPCGNK